jgi:hypothetical protein
LTRNTLALILILMTSKDMRKEFSTKKLSSQNKGIYLFLTWSTFWQIGEIIALLTDP